MRITRSKSGDLHRDGFPAIQTPTLTQYYFEGKLHCSHGPAVTTPNGGEMYYWRGLHIPQKIWFESENYSYKDIMNIANIELRRAVTEKVGFGQFIQESTLHDKGVGDFEGCALYSISDHDEQPPDDRIVFVELKNSTMEPNGTYNMYYLRVPPHISTVEEAINWSFGIEELEYVEQT